MNISIIHIIYIHVPAIMKSSLSNLITVFLGGGGIVKCSVLLKSSKYILKLLTKGFLFV